tara:strand:- start:39479 stop:39883 length:405 start_codon:yes stop_codon:yes gene_type:complete
MYRILLFPFLLFFILILIVSCGKGDKPEPPQKKPTREELLVKNWDVVSVTSNNLAIEHSGFTIAFKSDGNFNFNTPGISGLPPSGTWAFSSDNVISLNGTIDIHVGELKANKFVFTYNSTSHKDTNVETEFTME